MLRPGLAADRRHEAARSATLIQARAVAANNVAVASSSAVVEAVVEEKIGDAVSSDLSTNPYIAAKLQNLNDRLEVLEP